MGFEAKVEGAPGVHHNDTGSGCIVASLHQSDHLHHVATAAVGLAVPHALAGVDPKRAPVVPIASVTRQRTRTYKLSVALTEVGGQPVVRQYLHEAYRLLQPTQVACARHLLFFFARAPVSRQRRVHRSQVHDRQGLAAVLLMSRSLQDPAAPKGPRLPGEVLDDA